MESKYNERHVEISKLYNRSLEEGRYEDSIVHLDEMIFIAEEENGPNDKARLLLVKEGIQMYIGMTRRYNDLAENNKSKARKLTQEPQQLANSV